MLDVPCRKNVFRIFLGYGFKSKIVVPIYFVGMHILKEPCMAKCSRSYKWPGEVCKRTDMIAWK
jgi:hypothetical protein